MASLCEKLNEVTGEHFKGRDFSMEEFMGEIELFKLSVYTAHVMREDALICTEVKE